ncbi:MAG TPA: PQQ-binding-like beta-propeller repeat protein, partial [Lysobacter sp.]
MATVFVALALVGCGGGGGGGSSGGGTSPPGPVAPPPTPTIVVTVAADGPIQQTWPTGDPANAVLTGRVTATNLASGSVVYLKLRDTTGTYRVPVAQPAAVGQTFRYEIPPSPNHLAGNYAGQFEITPCGDAQCTQVWGPAVRVDYGLYVTLLGEWEGYQRDSAHAGYVPTAIDTTRLELAWEWRPSRDPAAVGVSLTRPATSPDGLYVVGSSVMPDGSEQSPTVFSVGAYNGQTQWSRALASTAHAVAPTTAPGTVFATTLNDPTLVTAFNDSTGAVRFTYPQTTLPTAAILSPTTFAGQSFFFAGANGEELHAITTFEGWRLWARPRVGLQIAAPTVNSANVIYQAGGTIEVLNARDGSPVASLVDPASDGAAYPGPTAVALGTHGNAIVNSYNGAQGSSRLSSFHVENRRHEWSTSQSYRPLFAVG